MRVDILKIDSAAINEGRWIGDLALMPPEVRLRVRGLDCRAANKLRDAMRRENRSRARPLDDFDLAEAMRLAVLRDVCLIDVEGFEDATGAPLDVTAVRGLLSDPDYAALLVTIEAAALRVGLIEAERVEDLAKN